MEPFPESFEVDELVLRPPAESDRDRFIQVLSASDEIARWTTLPYPYTSKDFDDFLEKDGLRWVVDIDGEPAGVIDANPDFETATATFGYWLMPNARGGGVITRVGSPPVRTTISAPPGLQPARQQWSFQRSA